MIGYPYTTILGILFLTAILISTLWVEGMRITLTVGLPWLAAISLAYLVWKRTNDGGKINPSAIPPGAEQ
jgi:L-asparagine transporter-like permease